MTLDDIDTPISEDELYGDGSELLDPTEVVKPDLGEVDPAKEVAPVVEPTAEPAQDRSPVIPRARFDEVNAKLHAEREQVEALRAQLAAQQQSQQPEAVGQVDVVALEKEYFAAMMAGEEDKAIEIRGQINNELFSRAEASAADRVTKQLGEREAKSSLDSVVAQAVSTYSFLDVNSADSNTEAIAEVVELRDFYMFKGDPLHVALSKAVAKVGPTYSAQSNSVAAAPTDTRKAAALARNALDAMAQPPAQVAGVGNRAAPPQPKIETQKDWEKLTDAERDSLLA